MVDDDKQAVIYTWTYCPFCVRAKQILDRHGIAYEERVMDGLHAELNRVKAEHKHHTVPIIILNGQFVGGCYELEVMARAGQLG